DLATYHALERRVSAAAEGWTVEITPPAGPLPVIAFAEGDALEGAALEAATLSGWAARRWNVEALAVPGLPADLAAAQEPSLAERRALVVATVLAEQGVRAVPA